MKMDFIAQMRKSLASITLTALVATLFVSPAQAALGFTDESEIPSWADEAIEELMDQGVVNGNDDGSFAPNRQLNRAEVSKIITLATGIDIDTTGGPNFPDVDPSAWYYDHVETMYNQGWIHGYPDGYFRPGVGINRAEIAKMVVNAFELDRDLSGAPHFDDANAGDWFYDHVETIYNNGCMRGYGNSTFGPANQVTRAETVTIVYCAQLVVAGPVGPAEGTLEVMLSDDTPRGTNIPYNATSVPFTTVELTASDDSDVEISSLTFTRLGLGDNDDFDNIWLEIDGFKVGNDKSVNNDDVVELRFNPPIVVPAGQTIVADVVASAKYTLNVDGTCFGVNEDGCNIGHHNRLALVSAQDIVSSAANIVGDFPVEGEEMEVADYRVSELKFGTLGADTTVDVGDNFVEIGKFRLLNASTSNKDIEIRAITFKNDGTAELEDNLENVALYVSGEQVSAETIIDGDYITFRLDNGITGGYIVEDGDSRIFSVRADIVSAEKGDVVNFKVDNFEDIVGVEIGTAFGVKALSDTGNALALNADSTESDAGTSCSGADAEDNCARLKAYAIDSGDLNISRDPASLGNQQYAPGSNDVVFLTARLIVDQPLIVDGVRINLLDSTNIADVTALNAAFDNFRVYLNDKLIDSENEFSGSTLDTAFLDFNTTFEITGTSVLKVVGNVEDTAPTGSKVRLEVQNDAFDSPEYISTGDQVTSDEILGSAQASFVEVEASDLIITKSDGLSDGDKIVAGVDDVTFLKFVLDNNDSGDVNVTSVSIGAIGQGAAAEYSNFTANIFVDGVQQGSSRNLSSNGTATFNDLAVVIASAGQKEFEVVVDTIESSANTNPASTTLAAGTNSETVLGALISGSGTVAAGNATGTIDAAVAAASAGDKIAVVNNGLGLTDTNTEINILASDVALGATSFSVTTAFNNGHPEGSDVYKITQQYPVGTSTFTLASVNNVAVGDELDFDGDGTSDCTVDSISGNDVTCDAVSTVIYTVGDDVDETSADSKIRLFVTSVDADNVENGQSVTVMENGETLGLLGADTSDEATKNDANCDGDALDTPNNNYLCGIEFALVKSGTLTVADGAQILNDSNILVAGQQDVEVYKVRLSAANDEIQVQDLYFKLGNTEIGDRVDFKLYNEAGELVQEKQAAGDTIHFQLANQNRIRVPKDNSTTITLKVDVRDITKSNQTGKVLDIMLDTTAGTGNTGVEAVTAATGTDVEALDINLTATSSDSYIAYRTTLTFANASIQPTYNAASSANESIFNFTATNDVAYEALLNRVSFSISVAGTTLSGTDYQLVKHSNANFNDASPTLLDTSTIAGTLVLFDGFSDEVDGTGFYQVRAVSGYSDSTPDGDDSEIAVSFLTDAVADSATTAGAVIGNIVWSDRSNSGGEGQFLNGFELIVPTGQSAGAEQ